MMVQYKKIFGVLHKLQPWGASFSLFAVLIFSGWYLSGVDGWDHPTNLLYQYQTLIAGLLAIFSVAGLVWQTKQSMKHANEAEERRLVRECKAIACSLMAEMTLNRFQLSELVDDQMVFGRAIIALDNKENYWFDVSYDVYNAHLHQIGVLGPSLAQAVITAYKKTANRFGAFVSRAPILRSCIQSDGVGNDFALKVSGEALMYINEFCKDIMLLDLAIESLALLAEVEVHPAIAKNLEQRETTAPESAAYVPSWRR